MKIAVFLPALEGGGAERVILTLVQGFVDRGHAVDLVLTRGRGALMGQIPDGVTLVDLDQSRIVAALWPLARYLRRARPHVVLSALTPANVVALLAVRLSGGAMPIVVSEHSTPSKSLHGNRRIRARTLPWLMRRTYAKASGIVAVSAGVAADLGRGLGLGADRITVIPNPVLTPQMLAQSHQVPDHPWLADGGPPVILAVGRLTEAKDFPTLLRAFARVRQATPVRLILLGEGPLRAELEEMARDHGLSAEVDLPGFTANPYGFMRQADLFVLSSAWEGFALVLAEALACGARVVSTDCQSGPAEILDGGRLGALVPVGDAQALARAMAGALAAPRPALRPEDLDRYTAPVAIEAYLACLTEAAHG